MRLTENPIHYSVQRKFTTVAICILFSIVVCASTLALSIHVDALAAGQQQPPTKTTGGPVAVSAEIMQKQIVHKIPPVYPEDAKKAQITGIVQLEAVIGKTGEVEHLEVLSGPKELQQPALDAVRQWIYKPFLLNGAAVEVKTPIKITYSLRHP